MTQALNDKGIGRPLRLWPGVALVGLQWVLRFVVPAIEPQWVFYGMLGALGCFVVILLWWLFFSRAPWSERLGAPALMILALAVTPLFLDKSIVTGAMGMLFYILVLPGLSLAFVIWAVAARGLVGKVRWLSMAATIFLACGAWALVRTGGFTGGGDNDLAWRWSATPEDQLLAQSGDEIPTTAGETVDLAEVDSGEKAGVDEGSGADAAADMTVQPEWPGFRGPDRNGQLHGVRIETDWGATPPVEIWRRPVGPGWSSFAVQGDVFYTQEQRGEEEIVACYRVATGEPVWMHADAARFWESNGGAGPRGTPTLRDGHVYSLGGTGILNVLDATDGAVVWSRDAAADTGAKQPMWGFSGSPLVLDEVVLVATSGVLAAYDRASGEPRWTGPNGGEGYSSPHLVTLDGVAQVLQLSGSGAAGFDPADGSLLWEHEWSGFPIVQPALTGDGDVLISISDRSGTRRLAVSHGGEGWTVEPRWTSTRFKPYFNDFVVLGDFAYGFDGSILACIALANGERVWKGGRYGHGQLILLADQDVLLVLSEKGELALVEAKTDAYAELARVPAIVGKTWNHPVLAGDVLLVRNAEEMAAFRLVLKSGQADAAHGP